MLFSRKENVFMCLVVFQKTFRKIFSSVWKMLQGKDKPISTPDKTQINARCSRSRRAGQTHHDRTVDRNLAKHCRFARSRSARRRDRNRRRNLAKRRSRSRKHRANRDRREGEIAINGAGDHDQRRWCLRTAPTGASPSRERR